ncbi:DUF3237 domain-containing protein [Nocardia inohanensis]|uniref:DUF3237 domain-containing protein n=1 Tax=Nocardia inohanensis TaxID=209246 RepID=UPI000830ECC9|nr:DUF3237 domain-containing protein [Nocardia inohanensis]
MDARIKDVGEPETRLLFDMAIDLAEPLDFGAGPIGRRVLYRGVGGTFEGPKLSGEVVQGGGDWAVFRADGCMQLDVRLILRTDDGDLIHVTYGGRWVVPEEARSEVADTRHLVEPSRYYFRTTPLFETGSRNYAWLNGIVAIGSGYLIENGVAYRVSEVL